MTVTRRIESPEFKALLAEEGGTVRGWVLKPFAFNPPLELDKLYPADPYADSELTLVFLNVVEPVFYRGELSHELIVILPKSQSDEFSYEYMADVHPAGERAWGYRIAPQGWDPDDESHDLDDAGWFLKYDENKLPPYEADRKETH